VSAELEIPQLDAKAVTRYYIGFCAAVTAGKEPASYHRFIHWVAKERQVADCAAAEVQVVDDRPEHVHYRSMPNHNDGWLLIIGGLRGTDAFLVPAVISDKQFGRLKPAFQSVQNITPGTLKDITPALLHVIDDRWKLIQPGKLFDRLESPSMEMPGNFRG
jgi:hypothetical protein